jgi:hypothetical protein
MGPPGDPGENRFRVQVKRARWRPAGDRRLGDMAAGLQSGIPVPSGPRIGTGVS